MSDSSNLDVLRAIAVCMVIACHVLDAIFGSGNFVDSIGRAGVLCFFVHTATVLMYSLERNPSTKGFYIRRFFRIYPLSVATVILVVLGRFPLMDGLTGTFHVTALQVVANLFLVQNLLGLKSVIVVLWSLPLEVQIYIVLPLLFVLSRRIELLWVLSLIALKLGQHFQIPMQVMYYVPCFLPGVIAWKHSKFAQRRWPAWMWPVLILALSASILIQRSVVQWVACLILGLAIPRFRELPQIPIARLTAKYSYGIYLSHLFAIYFAFTTLHLASLFEKLAVTAICVPVFALFCYHVIEYPFIRFGKAVAAKEIRV